MAVTPVNIEYTFTLAGAQNMLVEKEIAYIEEMIAAFLDYRGTKFTMVCIELKGKDRCTVKR